MNGLESSALGKRLCLVCNLVFPGDLAICPSDGSQLATAAKPRTDAEIVPGFRLKRQIGQGAAGIVFEATRIGTTQSVAIKILRLSLASDVEVVKRFKKEVELTRRLLSNYIVAVEEYGFLYDGRPYMVMDYIDGCTLGSIVETEGALAAPRALPIFIQIAAGLAQAHEHGVMHRDIKLGNIMLVDNGKTVDAVKIVDFGIAKQWLNSSNNSIGLTLAGEAVGSPSYMSPEQCLGTTVDHRTDIYSLGCSMYQTLTGREVFSGQNAVAIMAKHIYDVPQQMDLPSSCVSGEIERIVSKAMAKKPEDRYATTRALKSDLQFCLYVLGAVAPVIDGAVTEAA